MPKDLEKQSAGALTLGGKHDTPVRYRVDTDGDRVVVLFSLPVAWLALTQQEAENLAAALTHGVRLVRGSDASGRGH